MTVEVNTIKDRLRASADAAARRSAEELSRGHQLDAQFHAGRQAAFLTAIHVLTEHEDAEAQERDQAIVDERIGEEAARLGLIGEGASDAVREHFDIRIGETAVDAWRRGQEQRLEEFARTAGGAVDMASGTVYSDADGGL